MTPDGTQAIAAIGMFDGVHRGHAEILRNLKNAALNSGMRQIVFTFAAHPLATVRPDNAPKLLTDISLRTKLIHDIAPQATVVPLIFSPEDFRLTANQFTEQLRRKHGVTALVMGFDNCIGCDRRNAAWLAGNGNIDIAATVPPVILDNTPASSSRIRKLIADTRLNAAADMLGHNFTIRGTVVPGKALGRKIGFPTANISPLESSQLIPPRGVYAVTINIDGQSLDGMANIGSRPTLDDGRPETVEVNIFDFDCDIYNRTIDINFIEHIRHEKRFASIEQLAEQIRRDEQQIRNILNRNR